MNLHETPQGAPIHEPVLVDEVLKGLNLSKGNCVMDCTAGLGGHARAIAKAIGPEGTVIALDRDAESLKICQASLNEEGVHWVFVHRDYRRLQEVVREVQPPEIDAILIDCGISSYQLGETERGFAFQTDGPLDMRMDRTESTPLTSLLDRVNEEELATIIWEYGEERYSRRIARAVLEAKRASKIRGTRDLADVIRGAVPRAYRHGRIHAATRSFQALRIAVNDELRGLSDGLDAALQVLRLKGRLAVISFHSMEDRIVKRRFKKAEEEGLGKVMTKKPIRPSDTESHRNPRSRSAKLRIFEKRNPL